jgi:hypothetical protein
VTKSRYDEPDKFDVAKDDVERAENWGFLIIMGLAVKGYWFY